MSQGLSLKGALRRRFIGIKTIYPKLSIREPRHIIELPSLKNISKVDLKYPLLEPIVHAHIKWDSNEKKLVYNVVEPQLKKEEEKILKTIENDMSELIDIKLSIMHKKREAIKYIQDKVNEIVEESRTRMSKESYVKIMYYIIRDFVGINDIEPLMHDPYIEDIGCSGMNTPIYIVHRKFGSIETNIRFTNFDYLSNFVVKLSERCGR